MLKGLIKLHRTCPVISLTEGLLGGGSAIGKEPGAGALGGGESGAGINAGGLGGGLFGCNVNILSFDSNSGEGSRKYLG